MAVRAGTGLRTKRRIKCIATDGLYIPSL